MEMETTEAPSHMCVCCLTCNEKRQYYHLLTVLPEFQTNSLSLLDLINIVTLVKVSIVDDLPTEICLTCTFSLRSAYNFIEQFKKSQCTLQSKFGGSTQEAVPVKNIKIEDNPGNLNVYVQDDNREVVCEILKLEIESDEDNTDDIPEGTKSLEILEPKPKLRKKTTQYECNICQATVTTYKEAIEHNEQHHPQNSDSWSHFKCDTCDKVCISERKLRIHKVSYHHPDKNRYKCRVCNEVFPTRPSLNYHMRKQHVGKKHKCPYCDKKFIYKANVKSHIQAQHDKTLPNKFLCSLCGKGFKYSTAMKYHMAKHTNSKNFMCKFCGYKCYLVGELRSHEAQHLDVRPYKCSFCEKAFKRNDTKVKHERIHKKEYQFLCEYCEDKGFVKKYNFKVHMLQHHGKFKCQECYKTFVSEEILNFHYMKKHKVKQTPSDDSEQDD